MYTLDLLEGPYRGVFRHVVILCPTVRHNDTYQRHPWIWVDPEVFVVDPGKRLHEYLRAFQCFQGEPTLYTIDDCRASKALTKKRDTLSELAFSGRHAQQSVWVVTQKFNSILKDLREQTRWVALFHCKDRNSFQECLAENDMIPMREERAAVRQKLAATKHAKLVLKTDQPAAYHLFARRAAMWEASALSSCLLFSLLTFAVVAWAAGQYIRARRRLDKMASMLVGENQAKMDTLIDELLDDQPPAEPPAASDGAPGDDTGWEHRERLAPLAAGGQARRYLGKNLTAGQIDSLSAAGCYHDEDNGAGCSAAVHLRGPRVPPDSARKRATSHVRPRVFPVRRPRA